MRKKIISSLIILSCLAITITTVVLQKRQEPQHAGRKLTYWLAELDTRHHPSRREHAAAVVQQIGTNALPTLLAILSLDESSTGERIHALLKYQTKVEYVPVPQRRWLAIHGFRALGPEGAPAIPQLTVLLNREATCLAAMFSLVAIGPEAVPALKSALTNDSDYVRTNAAWGLSRMGERV